MIPLQRSDSLETGGLTQTNEQGVDMFGDLAGINAPEQEAQLLPRICARRSGLLVRSASAVPAKCEGIGA